MANRYSRAGGKFTGSHTTLTHAASILADAAATSRAVERISPGFLKAGLRSVGGKRRVKITRDGGRLLLAVRDNTTHQEVHVYATDMEEATRVIAAVAEAHGLQVAYGSRQD